MNETKEIVRNEYPYPQRERKVWQPLNGEWEFGFCEENGLPLKINVPFAYQSALSGIGDAGAHERVKYAKTFTLTEEMRECETVRLNFLAVDYACTVYVNGKFALCHEGGYGEFGADIKPLLNGKSERIEVEVYDPLTRLYPRGKQNWQEGRQRCWYHCTSGIWQSAWLDGAHGDYMTDMRFETDADETEARAYVDTEYGLADEIEATVKTPSGKIEKFSSTVKIDGRNALAMAFAKPDCIDDWHKWTANNPCLYFATIRIKKDGEVLDEANTYFGFRTVSAEDGRILINDRPEELRLVLNQGYWKDGGATAPSAEEFKRDILLAKEMGFNGMRMHQKLEDPWLYYYADTLGFYLWAETPSAYAFTPKTTDALLKTQQAVVRRSFNSPSVIAYVPFNESWGIKEVLVDERKKDLCRSFYRLIKSLDPSRLVVTNDGWENLEEGDLIGLHDYSKYGDDFEKKYAELRESSVPATRRITAHGESADGLPVMLSEFGGVALEAESGWGYGGAEKTPEDLLARLERLMKNAAARDFCGWCYTQLSDVEQEINGLLDDEHKPKVDVKRVREIIDSVAKRMI